MVIYLGLQLGSFAYKIEILRPYRRRPSVDPTEGMTKEDAAKAFIEWQAALPARDMVIFTDGSQLEMAVRYGFVIYVNGTLKAIRKGKA